MNKGILYAAGAYVIWGFFPFYLKWLQAVPALQIMTHRVVWSFVFLLLMLAGVRQVNALRRALSGRVLLIYGAAGLLLAANWLIFVWAVNSGQVVEASLGYFINPLVSVVLGVAFLKEKLRLGQWLPVALAAAGVLWLTFSLGALPWISLALAGSFGFYGLFKKVAPLNSLQGLALETGLITPLALTYLLLQQANGTGAFSLSDGLTALLLALTGVVTAVPLLLFSAGARRVPLSTLGLLQYIAPSLQFLSGVFIFEEAFTPARWVGFAVIWLALLIFSLENTLTHRRQAADGAA